MNPDKLTKELKDFEKMTRAVVTVGEAVKENWLKAQRVKELEALIEKTSSEVSAATREFSEIKVETVLEREKARKLKRDAESVAREMLVDARKEADAILLNVTLEAKEISAKVESLNSKAKALSEEVADLDKKISEREASIEKAKDKLRSMLN